MTADRLSSRLIVDACLRAAAASGASGMILRRGDPDAGAVMVKAYDRQGRAVLYTQTSGFDGEAGWRQAAGPAPEMDIDERIDREARIDRDLWVVEVLDDALAHPLGPVSPDA